MGWVFFFSQFLQLGTVLIIHQLPSLRSRKCCTRLLKGSHDMHENTLLLGKVSKGIGVGSENSLGAVQTCRKSTLRQSIFSCEHSFVLFLKMKKSTTSQEIFCEFSLRTSRLRRLQAQTLPNASPPIGKILKVFHHYDIVYFISGRANYKCLNVVAP